MARIVLYIGDRNPALTATLTNPDGSVVNGTGHSSPTFSLRREFASSNAFSGTGSWVSAAAGTVTYALAVNDLVGLTPGYYNGQFTDTDAAGRPMHFSAGPYELRKGF